MSHRLTIKGQVTIPKEIRELLGLEAGNSCVEFSVAPDGSVVVTKATVEKERGASHSLGCSLRSEVRRSAVTGRPNGGVLALLAGGF